MSLQLTFEQQKKAKAIGITVGIHLLLFLFLFLYKYAMPLQAIPEPLGLEVNLGTSENGFGTDQPEHIGSPTSADIAQASSSGSNSPQVALSGIITSDNQNEPAASISPEEKANKHLNSRTQNNNSSPTGNTTSNSRTQKKAEKPKYTYAGSSGDGLGNEATRNNAGSNEGIGIGKGDMGVPAGTPGASNYKGVPGGHGNISALVGNRYLVGKPDTKAKYNEGGKVIFTVTVDRNGVITDHHLSLAANPAIKAIALKKLKSVKFNKDAQAKPEESGTIIFDFVTR